MVEETPWDEPGRSLLLVPHTLCGSTLLGKYGCQDEKKRQDEKALQSVEWDGPLSWPFPSSPGLLIGCEAEEFQSRCPRMPPAGFIPA